MKSVSHYVMDAHPFNDIMETHPPPDDLFDEDVSNLSEVLNVGSREIESVSRICVRQNNNLDSEWDITSPRWKRFLDT